MALHREGWGLRAIARELHLSRNTVRRYVCSPGFPERAEGSGRRPKEKTKLGPYLAYLRQRWEAGIHNTSQLKARDQSAWLYGEPIGTAKGARRVANRTAAQTQAGQSTQTAPLHSKGAAASFGAVRLFSDDFAARETER